jgi:DNA-directed RNA polymerase specialized sigma24 family protein
MSNGPIARQNLELMKRIPDGDAGAFRELYDLTHKKIYFYLYRLVHGRQLAEDVMVEAYSEVWRCAKPKARQIITLKRREFQGISLGKDREE